MSCCYTNIQNGVAYYEVMVGKVGSSYFTRPLKPDGSAWAMYEPNKLYKAKALAKAYASSGYAVMIVLVLKDYDCDEAHTIIVWKDNM